MTPAEQAAALESLEVELLLEGIHRHWGHELRHHARPALLRQVRRYLAQEGLESVSHLQARILHGAEAMEGLLHSLVPRLSGLFAEPAFLLAFRTRVVPLLRTHPSVRLWHVGCGNGEETYALALILEEEGLLGRCRIYASDASERALTSARRGSFPLPGPQEQLAYQAAGGRRTLAEHHTCEGEQAVFHPRLREAIFFTQHHLATDSSFNEFHVVVCRNVLLSFTRPLAHRILLRLDESVTRFGYLCLGRKESLEGTPIASAYEELEGAERIFRRLL